MVHTFQFKNVIKTKSTVPIETKYQATISIQK